MSEETVQVRFSSENDFLSSTRHPSWASTAGAGGDVCSAALVLAFLDGTQSISLRTGCSESEISQHLRRGTRL